MADSATIIRCEHNKGVVIEPRLLQGGHDLCHGHVHVHHHGLVDVPRRVPTLWDQVHDLSTGLQWCMGRLRKHIVDTFEAFFLTWKERKVKKG